MKKLVLILAIFGTFIFAPSCDSSSGPDGHQCGVNETDRVGAKCNDGTSSSSTGSGTCSSHGGVAYWICG